MWIFMAEYARKTAKDFVLRTSQGEVRANSEDRLNSPELKESYEKEMRRSTAAGFRSDQEAREASLVAAQSGRILK